MHSIYSNNVILILYNMVYVYGVRVLPCTPYTYTYTPLYTPLCAGAVLTRVHTLLLINNYQHHSVPTIPLPTRPRYKTLHLHYSTTSLRPLHLPSYLPLPSPTTYRGIWNFDRFSSPNRLVVFCLLFCFTVLMLIVQEL